MFIISGFANEISSLFELIKSNSDLHKTVYSSLANFGLVMLFTFVILEFKKAQSIFVKHEYSKEPKTFLGHWKLYLSAPLMSANGICMWRVYASIPLAILTSIYYNDPFWSFIFFQFYIFLFSTDATDGRVARKLGNVTFVGKILDPLGDKFLVLSILNVVTYHSDNYFFIAIGIVLTFIDILGQFIRGKSKNPAATWVGKTKTIVTMFTIFMLSLNRYDVELNYIGTTLLLISLGFTFWSFYGKLSPMMKSRSIDFIKRFVKLFMKKRAIGF